MNTSLHLKDELYWILEKEIQYFTSPLAWTSTVELSLNIMSLQILYIHQMFKDTMSDITKLYLILLTQETYRVYEESPVQSF